MRYIDDHPEDNTKEIKQTPPDLKSVDPDPVLGEMWTGFSNFKYGRSRWIGDPRAYQERRLLVNTVHTPKAPNVPPYYQCRGMQRMKLLQELKAYLPPDKLHVLPQLNYVREHAI